MSEKWMPKDGEKFWSFDSFGCILEDTYCTSFDKKIEFGNFFKTRIEAVSAAVKVNTLLLGLHEAGGNEQLPKLTTEVFNRPDCPDWAKYAAVDECGSVRLFSDAPWLGASCWNWSHGEVTKLFGVKFDASDWQKSRIKRPKVNWDEVEEKLCNSKLTFKEKKQELPDWCKVGEWMWYPENTKTGIYFKIADIADERVFARNKNEQIAFLFDAFSKNAKQARLRPYNAEEMRSLVGKVVCSIEDKIFLVLSYSPNTVFFGEFSHTPEDLTLDIYKFPDGSPCGCLEHLENGEWVK